MLGGVNHGSVAPGEWPGSVLAELRGTWPKASDEADGNAGRPQPGFFWITGKKYFVLYLRWLGKGNFLVQILCGGSVIGRDCDPAPAPIASKEPEKGKRYFGLYLLVGGRKYPIYCKDSWRDYPLP